MLPNFRRVVYGLTLVLVTVGIIARLSFLDKKVYWIDEVYTSLRVAGYSEVEVVNEAFDGQPIGRNQLLAYLQTTPSRGIDDTIRGLVLENQHHTPAYYILAHGWTRLVGSSVAATRSLSAIAGIAAIAAMYWLGRELVGSSVLGAVAASLFAISPLHVIYAQEARSYSLWTLLILVSSALLLRAIRTKTDWRWWGLYSLSMAAGYYTFLFHGLVAIAHSIYIGIHEKGQLTPRLRAYGISIGLSLLLFVPWIAIVIGHFDQVLDRSAWVQEGAPLLQKWICNVSNVFVDLNLGSRLIRSYHVAAWLLVVGSLYWICKRSTLPVWGFVLTLAGVNALGLMLPDVLLGGQRSVHIRYLLPCFIAVTLAVAVLIGERLIQPRPTRWVAGLFAGLWGLLIVAGITSIALNLRADSWWNKGPDKHVHNPDIAHIINQSESPLLIADDSTDISDCYACRILTLAFQLKESVMLQLVRVPQAPDIPPDFNDVYVFSPTDSLLTKLSAQYSLELVFEQGRFKLYQLLH